MNRFNSLGPRILVLSASVGNGHVRAGQAVELALARLCPGAEIEHVDVLQLTNAPFRRLYGNAYFDLVRRAPHLVGYLYDRLDRPVAWRRLDRVRARLQRLNLSRLITLLTDGAWDLVINTHFLPAEVVAALRTAGDLEVPQVTVTTDFDTHNLWIHSPTERYFTATEEGRVHLAPFVNPRAIEVTGIPIHPDFARPRNREAARDRLGLPQGGRVVLQLAGGFGFGPVERIHRSILDAAEPVHVVCVAGRNAKLKWAIEGLPCPPRHRRTVLGYTTEIPDLMAAADVLVSKPGGLTCSEAMASGLPMLIVDPIPGQETRNGDYLTENGAALKVNNLASLSYKLDCVLADDGRRHAMAGCARRLGRPSAATDVARSAMTLIEGPKPTLTRAAEVRPRRSAGLQPA
jgi:processive 1,2-diacylglycerol beta-glucosyltransferase